MTEYVYSKTSGKKYEVLCRYHNDPTILWLLPEGGYPPFTAREENYHSGPEPAEGQLWRRKGNPDVPARPIQLVASGWVIILGPFQLYKAYRIDDFMNRHEYVGED